MDFNDFPYLREGPSRSAVIVLLTAIVAILIAVVLHRMGMLLMRRLVRGKPYTTALTYACFQPSKMGVSLFALRLVLTGAPPDTPGLIPLAHLASVSLILALTWLMVRCIESVSATMIQLHPVDVDDNLKARRLQTQTRVLARSANFIIGLLGLASVLLTLPGAKQIGASLLASAGVAGLVAGMAARPVLGNFIAGLQIAFSQPIRLDDVLIVNGEWGRVEEITGTFVVVRIWDERRLIVPLQWFIENPFENWTHTSSTILGTVFLWMDFNVPVAAVRSEFERVTKASKLWDGRVCVLHVTDASDKAMQLRLLVSAQASGIAFDLRCEIREAMIAFIAQQYPEGLPRLRSAVDPMEIKHSTIADADAMDRILDGAPHSVGAAS